MKFQWHSDSSMKALLWLNLTFECQLGMISCILDRSRPPRSSNNIRCNQCFLFEWMDIWIKISCWQTIQNVDDLLENRTVSSQHTGVERLIRTLCNFQPVNHSWIGESREFSGFVFLFAFIHSWLATRKNNIKTYTRGSWSGRMGQRSLCGAWC